jgi:hypothetical protein
VRDGCFVRLESFDPDDEPAILSRLEEVRSERAASPV